MNLTPRMIEEVEVILANWKDPIDNFTGWAFNERETQWSCHKIPTVRLRNSNGDSQSFDLGTCMTPDRTLKLRRIELNRILNAMR